ncbi:MAG: Na+/H+ antiporter subunit E [Chloroflexota bacterium]
MMRYVWPGLILTLVYLALTGNFALNNIVMGMLLAALVLLLLRTQPAETAWQRMPTAVFAFSRYIVWLMIELLVSGVQVARIVLDPKLPINPGIVAIATKCETDLSRALSAHAITLTPGEMVVEVSIDGVMYTHMLDATNADDQVLEAQQIRENMLMKIFS